jgi:outer membrane receptor protein involved in Fe transport
VNLCNRLLLTASLGLFSAFHVAQAQQTTAAATSAAASAAPVVATTTAPGTATGDLQEVVVNGIKRGDLIMPTTVTSNSAFGLDLSVMDTPRNNTVLSKVQIDALDVQNPGGFSYLTSSAYSDASFGQPNVPRIRGQYADMFYNGMRDSFTLNGYGAPISFNMVDSIDIVKGPASVQGGAGSGVGGSIDITTKMPSLTSFAATFNGEVDTFQKRIFGFDVGGPLGADTAGRVSVTSTDSGSYYNDMFFHQQALYAAIVHEFTPNYTVSLNGDITDTFYRENDGANRVNQAFINNGTYLTGAPPLSDVGGYGTVVDLTGTTTLNDHIIIDEGPGNGAHAVHAMLQLIQTYQFNDNFSITNNTFYDYINRYNQVEAYYADTAIGSYSIENKTDLKLKFNTGFVQHETDGGFTYRYAHVLDIQNYANEPVSVYDLSNGNPSSWEFPPSAQIYGGAIPYTAAFGHAQYGVPGSYAAYGSATIDSNLQDAGIFLEHRMTFSPQLSLMYGLRGDLVQLNDNDPLYNAGLAAGLGPNGINGFCPTYCDSLPQSQHTAWYGLYNGNISLVYSPTEHVSAYATFNRAQYVLANANDGAVGTLGLDPTTQLRQGTLLEEAGMKFDLLNKALFFSIAGFKQGRAIPTGQGGLYHSYAHITGAELELNYQPNSRFFATASYSYLHTVTDTPFEFWNFPAYLGVNYDGAATNIVWNPNQKFLDPGVPEHLFNVLANYKLENGLGFQANLQVTGPVQTTQAGYINIAETEEALTAQGMTLPPYLINSTTGYYLPPTIPWQFTLNTAVFYTFLDHYTVKFEVYNLTDQKNLLNDQGFYGNDFLTRLPTRSYDLTFTAKL